MNALDRLELELVMLKIIEECRGPQESSTIEDISNISFGCYGYKHKYFRYADVSILLNYNIFSKFISTLFLLTLSY